ncbi:MAG: glycosyltransferase family 1 protein [Pedobacter sp.]|nr:MAG: glycosyltransferase family 1 protein [Pedobacter sp.]
MHKPLKIAIDIRFLRVAQTGSRTYLEEICNELKKINGNEFHFYFLDSSLPIYMGNTKIFRWIEYLRGQLWKQITLPVKAYLKGSDILFCADDCVPYIHLGYKTVHAIHDAFLFESPQNYGKLWLWLYLHTAIPAAKRSSYIVTLTHWSKKQLHYYTGIPTNKLIVVTPGGKTLQNTIAINDIPPILQQHSISPGNYILHAGAVFKRKNIPALIKAFAKLKNDGHEQLKLVLAGPLSTRKPESDYELILDTIKHLKLQNDVIITGYLSDAELSGIYQNALMYVFPSINEGFGLPILEAFNYNLPVLVANNTCLPEVGGDAVLQFDPFDTNDIYVKMNMVLTDENLRKNLINKGQQRLNDFSWHKTVMQLISVFKNV